MILADKIINERKKNGWSQEELAEKLGVSRQSVSKWEGAQAVPDMQRIVEMSRLFGVSTDYLLKDEVEETPVTTDHETDPVRRRLSLDEAQKYLAAKQNGAPRIALGVALCIFGAAALIFFAAIGEYGILGFSEEAGGGVGLCFLLICVAVGVALMITSGMKNEPFEWLEKEIFDTEYGIDGMARERRSEYKRKYGALPVIGVVLCILAVIPMLVTEVLGVPEYVQAFSVGILLILVAAAVWMFVYYSILVGSTDVLLQQGDHTPQKKKNSRITGTIAGSYWLLAVSVYLAWSFATDS